MRHVLPEDDPMAAVPVLVIASPCGPGAAAIMADAGDTPLGPAEAAFGTPAAFDGMVPVDEMRALGAWSVRDGAALALLCGVTLK